MFISEFPAVPTATLVVSDDIVDDILYFIPKIYRHPNIIYEVKLLIVQA